MPPRDLAEEWRELSETYRRTRDEELVILARQSAELTEIAQQALAQEISYRRLKVPSLETPAPPPPEPDTDDPYAKERELVELRTVWSLRDALQLQFLLDRASIPFFMGPEKATSVEAVSSDFVRGVHVRVMSIGLNWASVAMENYSPADDPPAEPEVEWIEIPVRCPKCRSTDVVIGRLVAEAAANKDPDTARFEWSCDACGYEWENDGVVKE